MAGRPAHIFINHGVIVQLRARHLSWATISELLHVTPKTLLRWRHLHLLIDDDSKYTVIDDQDLDNCLKDIMLFNRDRGEIICKGSLQSQHGIFIKWKRFRESILRVDPIGPWWRSFPRINRGVYVSPGPNHTWHLDSNHKLRVGKLVIHGCIDGYSRHIKYLVCCDNNRSATVFNLFRDCVLVTGVPQRVYTDQGGENIGVATYMVDVRGHGHNGDTVMVGKSVHNVRIERLWREINHVTRMYKLYFHILDNQHNVNMADPGQRYVINRLFIPLLNDELDVARRGYNEHKMRTMDRKRQSPNEAVQCLPQFGIPAPPDAPLPVPDDNFLHYHGIVVENNICPLPDDRKQDFEIMVPSLRLHLLKAACMIPGQLNPVGDADGVMQAMFNYFDEKVNYALHVYNAIANAP